MIERMTAGLPVLLVAVSLAVPGAADAQESRRLEISIFPKAGWYASGGDLGEIGDVEEPIRTTVKSGMSYGAALELRRPGSFAALRVSGDAVFNAPIERGDVRTGGDVTIMAFAADALIRTYGETFTSRMNMYLLAGLGVKLLDFTVGPTDVPQISGSRTIPTLHFGAGFFIPAGPLVFGLEAASYAGWFDPDDPQIASGGQAQMDFFLHAGVRIPLR